MPVHHLSHPNKHAHLSLLEKLEAPNAEGLVVSPSAKVVGPVTGVNTEKIADAVDRPNLDALAVIVIFISLVETYEKTLHSTANSPLPSWLGFIIALTSPATGAGIFSIFIRK